MEVVKGAGIDEFKTHSGQEFSKHQIEQKESISKVEFEELGEFEAEIYEEISPISEAFIHNVVVDFEAVPQNREYDLLFLTTSDILLHISVKDYSGVDDSPTADDLINNPRNQATLIGADMTYSVVKGVYNLSPFLKEAELRDDITICEKQDCHSNICNYIQDDMMIETMSMEGVGGLTISFD